MASIKPESLQAKQQYQEKLLQTRKLQQKNLSELKKELKKRASEKTAEIMTLYKTTQVKNQLDKKNALNEKKIYVEAESNFICAVLIRTKVKMSADCKKVCELLRLKDINNLVILKNNKSIKKMLEKVKTHVAYGTIKLETLRKLFYTRSFCMTDLNCFDESKNIKFLPEIKFLKEKKNKHKQKNVKWLSVDEYSIWNHFKGKYCSIEELIAVIYFGKDDFKEVMKFFGSFKMEPPVKGYSKKKKALNICEGGAAGDWMDTLDILVNKMLR